MPEPTLHHRLVHQPDAEPDRWLYLLHGIYGAGRNWATLARQLTAARPDWGVALVDLRLHGESGGFDRPHTVEAAAGDVARLITAAKPIAAVLGHSFGGKVALELVRELDGRLAQAWIVDASPAAGAPGGSAWEMLAAVRALPRRFAARDEAVQGLEQRGYATPIARWMATNLVHADGELRWRLDFDAIEELLRDFFRLDLWPVVEDPPGEVRLHFVKARESGVLDEDACARIEAAAGRDGRVALHRLDGGHWVNADNPEGMLDLLRSHL